MFWENFLFLCQSKGSSPNSVAKKLGFSSGSVTEWKNGRIPRIATLNKIADHFGVNVQNLLSESINDDEKKELFSLMDGMTEDQLKQLKEYADFLRSKRG